MVGSRRIVNRYLERDCHYIYKRERSLRSIGCGMAITNFGGMGEYSSS